MFEAWLHTLLLLLVLVHYHMRLFCCKNSCNKFSNELPYFFSLNIESSILSLWKVGLGLHCKYNWLLNLDCSRNRERFLATSFLSKYLFYLKMSTRWSWDEECTLFEEEEEEEEDGKYQKESRTKEKWFFWWWRCGGKWWCYQVSKNLEEKGVPIG